MKKLILALFALFPLAFACGGIPEDDGLGQTAQAIDVSEADGLAGWRQGNLADKCMATPNEHCFLPGQTPGTGKSTYQLYVDNTTTGLFSGDYAAPGADQAALDAVHAASGYKLTKFGCTPGAGFTCLDIVILNGSVFVGAPTNTNQVAENFVRYTCLRFTPLSAPAGAGSQNNCTGTQVTFDVTKFSAWMNAIGANATLKSAWLKHMNLQMYAHLAGIGTELSSSVNSSNDIMSRTLVHTGNPFNTFLFSEACTMHDTDYTRHVGVWFPYDSPTCSG